MRKAIVLLLLCTASLNAQTFAESIAAYEAKDYKKFLELTTKMDSIRPMHPAISYNLALAHVLNGDNENAFRILKRTVLSNTKVTIDNDADFASFLKTDYYKKLEELRVQLNTPVANSKKITTLSEKVLHPEGLAYLDGTGWLATSVRKRKIVSFDTAGNCTDWLSGNDMLAVFSIKTDNAGKYLWAATAAIPEMENYTKAQEGKAEILKIDIASKTIVKRYTIEGNHVFGDLFVTASGNVYISDSVNPVIYKIGNDRMEEWLNLANEAYSLQGITMDVKEEILFVADYLKGIVAVSVKDRMQKQWLAFPEGATTKGIDGLTYYNGTLIAIHNGVAPIRLVHYQLNAANRITGFKVIDNNRPEFNEPVLGTIYNGSFYFFANSPWKAYNGNGVMDEDKVVNPELFFFRL